MTLKDIIIQRIANEGAISFHDFMEMALYFPGLGYYTSDKPKIGKHGDFYTTPELTDLFGKLLARQIEEMWFLMNQQSFTIVEYGAGTGKLCHDILSALKSNSKLYNSLSYRIIEKSEAMVEIEKERLHEKVTWHQSIYDIPDFCGCVIANEVLDNFSVHRVVMEEELMEIFVTYNDEEGFKEILKPAAGELKAYLQFLSIELPRGYQAEINLQALQWLREISEVLQKGFVVTIDYGGASAELYKPSSRLGSMLCFHQHQINESFYHNIGGQDITAHVNFSALQQYGLEYGLQCCGYTLQSHFLHSLGLVPMLQQTDISFYPLMMETAGKFRVLIQQKELDCPFLSGMKFAFSGNRNLNRVALR